MTTTASGFWMSAPEPVANSIGTWPMKLVRAVISSGRKRKSQPRVMVSSSEAPLSRSWRKNATSTTPFCTATPSSTMNATAALTDSGMPNAATAMMPPTSANGRFSSTRNAARNEPSARCSRIMISSSAIGTTMLSCRIARCWFSNWPPYSMR